MLGPQETILPPPAVHDSLVVLDYNDLVSDSVDLTTQLQSAFGAEGLGACVVTNVPGYVGKREKLLKLASALANLPQEALKKAEHEESSYLFGWSHGKEIMNGKADFAKGSLYNNPVYDVVPNADEEYKKKFPAYGCSNVWAEELPELKDAFMDLGGLIVKTGQLVARHCDKYLSKEHPDLPANFLESAIAESTTVKARLLHYFPIEEPAKPETATTTADSTQPEDSWCGLHVDHSMLTGLTSAMYVDESEAGTYTEIDAANIAAQNAQMGRNLAQSGLYIKTRGGKFVKVKIPKDAVAFQIGEAAQIASRGLLVATPHLVKGAPIPAGSGMVIARNTFAVFMQPNVDHKLTADQTFHQFTEEVMKRHYADRM
ncbi:uncharacterized protein EV422DRAFT_514202 [Fimicolochytrium jonesii]|uniref:uncharacterized protein n=1 Tax=Fimicolochytrium jonesii TaxID=1396493 RepID=UPI0022FE5CDC|nr:uncharacterized protein EV422DRAFT_514202 [Fimicolochytrium jonesii]KAI8825806.1 hypothetical protein EV422DRAFT_514202 [Fimicolochytrium jonesii]